MTSLPEKAIRFHQLPLSRQFSSPLCRCVTHAQAGGVVVDDASLHCWGIKRHSSHSSHSSTSFFDSALWVFHFQLLVTKESTCRRRSDRFEGQSRSRRMYCTQLRKYEREAIWTANCGIHSLRFLQLTVRCGTLPWIQRIFYRSHCLAIVPCLLMFSPTSSFGRICILGR